MIGRRRLGVAFLLGALLRAVKADAGMMNAPCERPFVFPDAAVNVVVMPYDDPTTPGARLTPSARRLSLLVQLDTLFSILKFGSVGAVHMASGPGCRPDEVLAKLVDRQPGARATVQPGHGLVFVWGRIYQEGEQILVQSRAHFLRRGEAERVEFRLDDRSLVGRLSTQVISFPPAALTLTDLDQIERAFGRAVVVRPRPEEMPGVPIRVGDPGDSPLAYWVTESRGDWIKIQPMGPGPSGWVPARAQIGGGALREKLPELEFVEALVGFLRMRQPPDLGGPVPADIASSIEQALRRFEGRATGPRADAVAALGHELWGVARLEGPEGQRDPEAAHRQFAEAARRAPQSAAARNLEVASRTLAAGYEPKAAAADLAQALALEPDNEHILRNLSGLYDVMARKATDPAEARELRLRQEAVGGLIEKSRRP